MPESTAMRRFRESATRMPEPCELSPRPIPGQLAMLYPMFGQELPVGTPGAVQSVEAIQNGDTQS